MHQRLKDELTELQVSLKELPMDIPIPKQSKYNFSNFSLDPDWIADVGEVGAVN